MNQLTQKNMLFDSRVTLAMAVSLLALLFGSSYAQTGTSTLRGTVADQQGAVVPDAKVTLRSAGKEFTRSQTTDAEGGYAFKTLPPDSYIIQVETPGFKKMLVTDVNVGADLSVEVNIALESRMGYVGKGTPIRERVTDIKPPIVEFTSSIMWVCGAQSYRVKDSAGGYLMFTMHTPDMPHPLTVDNQYISDGFGERPLAGKELKLLVKLLQQWQETAITREKQRLFEHYNGLKNEAEIAKVRDSFSEADSDLLLMWYVIEDLKKSQK